MAERIDKAIAEHNRNKVEQLEAELAELRRRLEIMTNERDYWHDRAVEMPNEGW